VIHPFFAPSERQVFAHRGGAALAPENTLAAFDLGLALGADGIELDVRLSRDDVVVVHHDATLERTTDRRGRVADFTAEELSRVDAGYRFGEGGEHPFRGRGQGIPRLDTVLSRYPNVRVIVELKENNTALASATIEVVRRANALDRVCLGSFGRHVLRAARALEPALATSAAREEVRLALYRSWIRWPVRNTPYGGYQVCEVAGFTRVVSPRFIELAHGANLRVQVWTVNQEQDARRLLDWGVDALITDRPDLMLPIVRELARPQSA
jgi:glycerophosphoryl diester phosphodiesterase